MRRKRSNKRRMSSGRRPRSPVRPSALRPQRILRIRHEHESMLMHVVTATGGGTSTTFAFGHRAEVHVLKCAGGGAREQRWTGSHQIVHLMS